MSRRLKTSKLGDLAMIDRRRSGNGRKVEDWSPDLLKSRAYEQILLDIILGVLPPCARLDEHGLAERYGIGLAGVRDALGRLALEGLVQRRARSGTIVTPLDIEEIEEAFDVRRLLEPHGAALAASYATAAEIADIERAYDGAEAAVTNRDYRALIAMDQVFHRAVVLGSHNMALARIVVPLHHQAARYWHHYLTMAPDHDRLRDVEHHRAVAAAIAERSPARARDAMLRVFGVFAECAEAGVRMRSPA